MKSRHIHKNSGVTLIEALVATVVVAILAIGGLSYQYLGAYQFRIARAELTATRTGQLLIEDWKGAGAPDVAIYDPSRLGFTPDNKENSYNIIVDGLNMRCTLDPHVKETDEDAGVTLQQLDVTVQWRKDLGSGYVETDGPSITLSTYARLGQD